MIARFCDKVLIFSNTTSGLYETKPVFRKADCMVFDVNV